MVSKKQNCNYMKIHGYVPFGWEKLQNIETNGKCICKRWNRLTFQLKSINIFRLVDET
jgi:hypothetical protein